MTYAKSDTSIPLTHVYPLAGTQGTYQVPSQSRSGQYHTVVYSRDGSITCSCEHNTYKGLVCKHILATARYRNYYADHSVALPAEQPAPQADPNEALYMRLVQTNEDVERAVADFNTARLRLEAAVKAQSAAMMAAVGEVK